MQRLTSAILGGTLLTAVLHAQTFDAASVKPSAPNNPNGSTFDYQRGGGLRVLYGTLQGLIESAYDIRDFQIAGGPGWLTTDRFDLVARSGLDAPPQSQAEDIKATRVRLQALLADRFKLAVHHEMREQQEYALVVDRKGLKLQADPDGTAGRGINSNCGHMTATGATFANLAFTLSRRLRRPVVDRTGLMGRYTFQLDWSSEVVPCADAPSDGPSIFTALQEKLGLRLDSIKGPVDTIVVDRAERPSAD